MQVSSTSPCLAYPASYETLNYQQHAVRQSPLTLHAIRYGHDKKDTWSVTPRVITAIEFHTDLLCQLCTCCTASDEHWIGFPSNMHASSRRYNVVVKILMSQSHKPKDVMWLPRYNNNQHLNGNESLRLRSTLFPACHFSLSSNLICH